MTLRRLCIALFLVCAFWSPVSGQTTGVGSSGRPESAATVFASSALQEVMKSEIIFFGKVTEVKFEGKESKWGKVQVEITDLFKDDLTFAGGLPIYAENGVLEEGKWYLIGLRVEKVPDPLVVDASSVMMVVSAVESLEFTHYFFHSYFDSKPVEAK